MSYYPDLPEKALFDLEIVLKNASNDPEYLSDEDCPYNLDQVQTLERLLGQVDLLEEEVDDLEIEGGDSVDVLERQSEHLFRSLMREQKKLEGRDDNAARMAFYRTATSLLDKIVSIKERIANVKRVHAFHDTVMVIMEDVLEPDQRTKVMDRLKEAAKA